MVIPVPLCVMVNQLVYSEESWKQWKHKVMIPSFFDDNEILYILHCLMISFQFCVKRLRQNNPRERYVSRKNCRRRHYHHFHILDKYLPTTYAVRRKIMLTRVSVILLRREEAGGSGRVRWPMIQG